MPIAPSAAVIVFGVAVGCNRTHSYLPVVSRGSGSPSSNPRATNRLINRARALLGLVSSRPIRPGVPVDPWLPAFPGARSAEGPVPGAQALLDEAGDFRVLEDDISDESPAQMPTA